MKYLSYIGAGVVVACCIAILAISVTISNLATVVSRDTIFVLGVWVAALFILALIALAVTLTFWNHRPASHTFTEQHVRARLTR